MSGGRSRRLDTDDVTPPGWGSTMYVSDQGNDEAGALFWLGYARREMDLCQAVQLLGPAAEVEPPHRTLERQLSWSPVEGLTASRP
jgi:hypothetical protein